MYTARIFIPRNLRRDTDVVYFAMRTIGGFPNFQAAEYAAQTALNRLPLNDILRPFAHYKIDIAVSGSLQSAKQSKPKSPYLNRQEARQRIAQILHDLQNRQGAQP